MLSIAHLSVVLNKVMYLRDQCSVALHKPSQRVASKQQFQSVIVNTLMR